MTHATDGTPRRAITAWERAIQPLGRAAQRRRQDRPRGVDESQHREPVAVGELHCADRLAVALRKSHTEVPARPLVDVAAFLMSNEHDRAAAKATEERDNSAVVDVQAVTVKLDVALLQDSLCVVERVRRSLCRAS